MKRLNWIWLVLFFAALGCLWGALARCQTVDSSVRVNQFRGTTVGAKLANAMQTCTMAPAAPCILVLDPSLAPMATGTIPTLCSNCLLSDWRAGPPNRVSGTAITPLSVTSADLVASGTPWVDIRSKGCLTSSSDNRACIQTAIQTVISAGAGTVFFPCGVWDVATPADSSDYASLTFYPNALTAAIRFQAQSPGCATIQYTGSTNIQGVMSVAYTKPTGSALTPPASYVGQVSFDGLVFSGNSHVQDGLDALRPTHGSFVHDFFRNVANDCLYIKSGVAVTFDTPNCSDTQTGAFSPQPVNGLVLDGVNVDDQSTTSTIITPIIEGVSGIALYLKDAAGITATSCQISVNPVALQIDANSSNDSFSSCLFEGGGFDGNVAINGSYNKFLDCTFSGAGLSINADENSFELGNASGSTAITIGTGTVGTHFDHFAIAQGDTVIADAGADTSWDNTFDFGPRFGINGPAHQWVAPVPTNFGIFGPSTIEAFGTWTVSKTTTIPLFITSSISGSAGTLEFCGQWNDWSAGGSPQPNCVELNAGNNSITLSSGYAMTFTWSGSNITVSEATAGGNPSHFLGFNGHVRFIPSYPGSSESRKFVGNVDAPSFSLSGVPTLLERTTGTITGTSLSASCDSGSVSITGAVVGHTVAVSSTTGADVGGAFNVRGSVTSAGIVTVYVCGTGTPASLAYNVTVF